MNLEELEKIKQGLDKIKSTDLDSLCLNEKKFGELTFEKSLHKLKQIQKTIFELENLGFEEYLTKNEINQVREGEKRFLDFLEKVENFNLSEDNPGSKRDSIEHEIENYHNGQYVDQLRDKLTYLRQELRLLDKPEKELQETLSSVKKLEKQMKEKIDAIEKDQASIKKGEGIVSSLFLSQEFNAQFEIYQKEADEKWFIWTRNFYIALFVSVIVLFIIYLTFIREREAQTVIEYGIFSASVIALTFLGFRFSVRNYNIYKNLAAINRQRRNVAETILNYLESDSSHEELQKIMIKDASKAMFEQHSTGYLDKDQMQVSTPIQEMVTKIITDKS